VPSSQLFGVNCNGTEGRIQECRPSSSQCSSGTIAGVNCTGMNMIACMCKVYNVHLLITSSSLSMLVENVTNLT